MKNTTRKVLALLVCLAMILSLAACSKKEEKKENTDNNSTNSSADVSNTNNAATNNENNTATEESNVDYVWEKYAEEVTITRGYPASGNTFDPEVNGIDDSDNIWTRWFKDTYNINVVNAFEIDSSEYSQKIDLLMATDNLPDVFSVTTAQLRQCIELGLIADLTDVFEKYASDELKASEHNYELGFQSGFYDGKLYGISTQYFGDGANMQNIWYRGDWAEKLNISKPTTLEEFKNMCLAFKNNDPDGNGIADTLPLTLDNNLANGVYTLMFAYGAYPNVWIEKDGKIEYGGVQPEAKAALAELNDWYNKGIIAEDWATTSRNQMKEGITNGTAGACLYASHIGYSLGVSLINNFPEGRLYAVAVPSATGEPIKYAVSWPIGGYVVVNSKCEHPEAAIKCMNGYPWASETKDAAICTLYASNNGGLTAPFRVNNATDMQQHIECVELLANPDMDTSDFLTTTMDKYSTIRKWLDDGNPEGYGPYIQLGPDGGYAQLRPVIEEGRVVTDMLRGPQTATMASNWSSLDTLLKEAYTQIICGQKPIDYFDEFVASWKALGGEQITIEMNEMYGK